MNGPNTIKQMQHNLCKVLPMALGFITLQCNKILRTYSPGLASPHYYNYNEYNNMNVYFIEAHLIVCFGGKFLAIFMTSKF
jgi:hypothetical protein